MLVTEIIKEHLKEECLADLKKIGITDIDSNVNAESDLDYLSSLGLSQYAGFTQADMIEQLKVLRDSNKAEFDKLIALIHWANRLSVYWILCNGVRFLVDLDSIIEKEYEPSDELMKLLMKPKAEDFIFDFYGDDVKYQCRFQKQHDTIKIKDKFYPLWIFSYCRLTSNDAGGTFELCIIPQLYPKIYVITSVVSDAGVCNECKICHRVEGACFKHMDGSTDNNFVIFKIPKNLQYTLQSNCKYGEIEDELGPFLDHNIRDYLNACLYAVEKYLKRKTIIKQGEDKKVDDHLKVAVPKEHKPSEVTFVTLRDRVIYEKHQKRSHSHHSSPREHVRRETERHLKDGRVIKVRSCVINKGKGDVKKQTVYKIT